MISYHLLKSLLEDLLRDEGREVNHHGKVRTFDADGNKISEDDEAEVWHSFPDINSPCISAIANFFLFMWNRRLILTRLSPSRL